jgi:hypothetical protein
MTQSLDKSPLIPLSRKGEILREEAHTPEESVNFALIL